MITIPKYALVAGLCVAALKPAGATSVTKGEAGNPATSQAAKEGIVHVSAFDLPISGLIDTETRAVLQRQKREREELKKLCPILFVSPTSAQDIVLGRRCAEQHLYPALIARHTSRYRVSIQAMAIAGVPTEIITPAEGLGANNQRRVLINLHGGTFMYGGRWGGQIESIPIAALAKIKVVAINYRLAPEHQFPAASEDVTAVYKALLVDYPPQNIGIYGCSAGGLLAAQSIAWFLKEGLPIPGAIGMFCAGAYQGGDGDSYRFWLAMAGGPATTPSDSTKKLAYFKDPDLANPLAFPGLSPQMMARFPDSLLVTSTRDLLMSSVVATHTKLVQLGVKADLHVWEGLDHAFFFDPDLPESREMYDVVARFFGAHLGRGNLRGGEAAADPR